MGGKEYARNQISYSHLISDALSLTALTMYIICLNGRDRMRCVFTETEGGGLAGLWAAALLEL